MSRWKIPEHFKVRIAGNTYSDCPTIIDYKGQRLFELRRSDMDGCLGINVDLYARNGSKLATVQNGQFVGLQPIRYSVEDSPGHYKLVEGATGKRVCEITLRTTSPDEAELDVSAHLHLPDGRLIQFDEKQTTLGGTVMTGNTCTDCGAAIRIT
jgi:hypothetical protein